MVGCGPPLTSQAHYRPALCTTLQPPIRDSPPSLPLGSSKQPPESHRPAAALPLRNGQGQPAVVDGGGAVREPSAKLMYLLPLQLSLRRQRPSRDPTPVRQGYHLLRIYWKLLPGELPTPSPFPIPSSCLPQLPGLLLCSG